MAAFIEKLRPVVDPHNLGRCRSRNVVQNAISDVRIDLEPLARHRVERRTQVVNGPGQHRFDRPWTSLDEAR